MTAEEENASKESGHTVPRPSEEEVERIFAQLDKAAKDTPPVAPRYARVFRIDAGDAVDMLDEDLSQRMKIKAMAKIGSETICNAWAAHYERMAKILKPDPQPE